MLEPEDVGFIEVDADEEERLGHVNEYVSVSRLKMFQLCPQQFRFRYVDHLPREKNDPAEFGTLLHAALETLYKRIQQEEFSGIIPEKWLVKAYRKEWRESDLNDGTMYEEGLAICIDYLKQHPDVDHFDIIAVEQEFLIEFEGYHFKGFIDRVDHDGDGGVVVIDYKSNRLMFEREELASDLQASIYLEVARRLWPWAKQHSFRFDMLRHGISQYTQRTNDSLRASLMYAADTARKTENPNQAWPAKIGPLCHWCSYKKICDAYKEALANGVEVVMVDHNDLLALSTQREQLALMIKPLDARKKEIDSILKKRLEDAPNGELRLGNYNYRVINVFRKSYPVDDTIALLKRYGATDAQCDSLVMLDKTGVDALARKLVEKMKKEKQKARADMFQMELKATGDEEFAFGRFDSRAINKELVAEPEIKRLREVEEAQRPPEFNPEWECSFCQKKPAKEKATDGVTFYACREHARKRKPPPNLLPAST